ncbi:16S rRNA (uracil(1498)-N(3))-methyltransferase [Microbacterium sp. EYE_5]|uniref:16S rRNA (uracil(1498)-N(3))-methyltransferase n=1 Tax=unclassified Microbacterium TaxID=2609290 RepID=UPI0020056B5D|nr:MULTISPECIES: 16S rRNA (uracil(1498)-N(3))-methyltransferase [unclassified Microbacterium]MCK6080609.1 16S rRNA (uracil(1498)-N(3))-methyltransferase [Microbacterium sp. EYE_382]MCK6085880.1 16S rRNA (uracil(1498)-N(3))-methyltransferase [Microbacterium sp. EYE_384]MCK6124622.1 16S rRNA (uracil(1498)-N(3))-methyltransferase [Microbacterium sp. EYE_80]MCK6127531.1 16S rRNA (uracil(1498)-N(3))-methyltransferase [Microbacterium sp. EYE_79]MCK6141564.1 16S rRNA (uracil(1498)-N(3))-methyltransfe
MALHFLTGDATAARPGDTVTLTGAEAHHAAAVRRIRVGEDVTVGDGRGAWLSGTVASVAPKEVTLEVTSRADVPAPSPRTVLVQALAKGDRDELAVQAATELGVDAIVPWQSGRSVSRWDGPKVAKGVARWETIAREAAKQAHRAWLADIEQPSSTRDLAARAGSARMLVLEPTASLALTAVDLDPADDRDVVLVVGPEGGIAPEELDALGAAGATLVRLGDTVLRTSTAGPVALALVNAALSRW